METTSGHKADTCGLFMVVSFWNPRNHSGRDCERQFGVKIRSVHVLPVPEVSSEVSFYCFCIHNHAIVRTRVPYYNNPKSIHEKSLITEFTSYPIQLAN